MATGNASYTELFNTGPGSLYFSGATGRVMVTQSQDGNTYLNPGTGAQCHAHCPADTWGAELQGNPQMMGSQSGMQVAAFI